MSLNEILSSTVTDNTQSSNRLVSGFRRIRVVSAFFFQHNDIITMTKKREKRVRPVSKDRRLTEMTPDTLLSNGDTPHLQRGDKTLDQVIELQSKLFPE